MYLDPTRSRHARTPLATPLILALSLTLAFTAPPAHAQAPAAATITGRIQNQAAGLSLENARVPVDGTNRETFPDAFGDYRLTGVAPGTVTLLAFSTGLAPQTATV